MRMWCVSPKLMCDKHLLGEHLEVHMCVSQIASGKSLTGYVSSGMLDSRRLVSRHDELVKEMEARGFDHKSPLPDGAWETTNKWPGTVSESLNLEVLRKRCPACFKLQEASFFRVTGLPLKV